MLEIPAVYNLYTFVFFIFGSLLGSFSNVIILRMASGASVVFPPSACPKCNHRLNAADLFPVLSWLFLRGRCRYCKVPISCQYPLVEATVSIIVGFSFYHNGLNISFMGVASALTIWFVASVIFLRNEVNKHQPFVWALLYCVLLVYFTQKFALATNDLVLLLAFAAIIGLLACRGKAAFVFTEWFVLSFIGMWAAKDFSLYYPGLIFLVLSLTFGTSKFEKTSRVLFFVVQVSLIGYKAII